MQYTPTIGLEIHAELKTKSKMFCGCANDPNAEEPNIHVCPVCLGYPGALPYPNKQAIEHMLRIGCALEGTLADYTEFDRKHYFYPDIPKGYQISQYAYPFVSDATLNGIRIQRIHLEEDTAKSTHDVHSTGTLVDFNRSGVPLMELVTDASIHDAETATQFAEMLQLTLRYLDVANARMEWGEMRVEANISVSKDETLGTKVEVKNLNSFKAVRGAIEFEIKRQIEVLEKGEKVVQETRGWNENTGKTVSQRLKETSAEYRYMPEPDIPKMYLSEIKEWDKTVLEKTLPELPAKKKERYLTYGLTEEQTFTLIRDITLAAIFDDATAQTTDKEQIKLIANYLTSDIMGYIEKEREQVYKNITGAALYELSQLILGGDISSRGAKNIIEILIREGGTPKAIAEKHNLFQQSDEGALQKMVEEIVAQHPNVVQEYKEGKEQALQFFVGQMMKQTKGSANPQKVQEILKKIL